MQDTLTLPQKIQLSKTEITSISLFLVFFLSATLFLVHPDLGSVWGWVLFESMQALAAIFLLCVVGICIPIYSYNCSQRRYWVYNYWVTHYNRNQPFTEREENLMKSYQQKYGKKISKHTLLDLSGFDKFLGQSKYDLRKKETDLNDLIDKYNITYQQTALKTNSPLEYLEKTFQQSNHLFKFLPNKFKEINAIIELNDPISELEGGLYETYKVSSLGRILNGLLLFAILVLFPLGIYYGYLESVTQLLPVWFQVGFISTTTFFILFLILGGIFFFIMVLGAWYQGRSFEERKQTVRHLFFFYYDGKSFFLTNAVLCWAIYLYLVLISGIRGFKPEMVVANWVDLKNHVDPNKRGPGRPKGSYDFDPKDTLKFYKRTVQSDQNLKSSKIIELLKNMHKEKLGYKPSKVTIKKHLSKLRKQGAIKTDN